MKKRRLLAAAPRGPLARGLLARVRGLLAGRRRRGSVALLLLDLGLLRRGACVRGFLARQLLGGFISDLLFSLALGLGGLGLRGPALRVGARLRRLFAGRDLGFSVALGLRRAGRRRVDGVTERRDTSTPSSRRVRRDKIASMAWGDSCITKGRGVLAFSTWAARFFALAWRPFARATLASCWRFDFASVASFLSKAFS